MLNKPKFMSPSINMYGNTVIDLNSATLPFSCIVDGNEAITDFRIVISKLKDNTVVFDTDVQKLKPPFFPINNRNQNVVFSIDLKEYFNTAKTNSGFVNSAEAYYWSINFKNSISGTETYSASEVFYANSIPDTTIYYSYTGDFTDLSEIFIEAEENYSPEKVYFSIEDGEYIKYKYTDEDTWKEDWTTLYYIKYSGLQKRKIYFKSTYNQAEGVFLKRYGWRLTDTTNGCVIMDTISQNQIYGISDDISCLCNGLVNGTSYSLDLYIETQNGYFDVLQSINFDVDYTVKSIDADFEVTALNNTSGIMLDWGNLRTTEGVVIGDTVDYVENLPIMNSASIEIPYGTNVVFSGNANGKELSIEESSYVVLSFQFDKDEDSVIFEMSGTDEMSNIITRSLTYTVSDRILKYTIMKGDTIAYHTQQLSESVGDLCWYVITLYPLINDMAYYKLIESEADGGLFPSEDLYPEESLHPYFGEWDELRNEVD